PPLPVAGMRDRRPRPPGPGGRALPPLSDDVPFRVNWPGRLFSQPTTGVLYKEDNYIIMTTVDKEKYKCLLPLIASGNEVSSVDRTFGRSGVGEDVSKQKSVCFKIESYWTYEEKETGQINLQEYYLGNMMMKSHYQNQFVLALFYFADIPTKNIEGQMTPYYPVEMGNGTPCSLRQNLPRSSTVMYICHPEAKHEILSVAEVTTCEYEVVILTPLLCNHPKYRFRASPVNDIFCQSLKVKEEEMQSTKEEKFSSIHKPVAVGSHQLLTVGTTHISKLTDEQLIKEFLSGSYCFHGGVGWWKYEFCYGKYVHQYHEVYFCGGGYVNKEEHIEWARKNAARTYHLRKMARRQIRFPHAVTIYMLEPHSCQYILGVESPVICKILDTADEHGLLSVPS
uniref:Endoplasmic reticulum lectin n=1 Tax=Melopsittacus undulatus TaxID=13146 RepID=A0A8V5G3G2_MELUD